MKPKVLCTAKFPDPVTEYLKDQAEVMPVFYPGGHGSIYERLSEVEGIMNAGVRIDAELLSHAPKLRAVANVSVGYENFDTGAMKERGVIGTITPYVLDDAVADLIIGLMLAVSRRITYLDRYIRKGMWDKGDNECLYGQPLTGRRLGIIGMGRIGAAVAKRARHGFEMEICYHNRRSNPEWWAHYLELDQLLETSDYIVVLAPATAETHKMIGMAQFAKMKKTEVFINASRGWTVDENALCVALKNGMIYGAGLDVYEREPLEPDSPLLRMDNVVLVPHIGSAIRETREAMAMTAAQCLIAALTGGEVNNIVPELT